MGQRADLATKATGLGLEVVQADTIATLIAKIAGKEAGNGDGTQTSTNKPKSEPKAKPKPKSDGTLFIVEALKVIRHNGEAVKIGDPIELTRDEYLDLRKCDAVTSDPDAEEE